MTNYYPTKAQALASAKGWRKSGYNAKVLPPTGKGEKRLWGVSVTARKIKKIQRAY